MDWEGWKDVGVDGLVKRKSGRERRGIEVHEATRLHIIHSQHLHEEYISNRVEYPSTLSVLPTPRHQPRCNSKIGPASRSSRSLRELLYATASETHTFAGSGRGKNGIVLTSWMSCQWVASSRTSIRCLSLLAWNGPWLRSPAYCVLGFYGS